MSVRSVVKRALRSGRAVLRSRGAVQASTPSCLSIDVRTEDDLRSAALRIGISSGRRDAAMHAELIRELAALNTPALYLDIVEPANGVRVVLRPWDRPGVRFVGSSYMVWGQSAATEGVEAFISMSHDVPPYVMAPDHPVHALAIHRAGRPHHEGRFGPDITHVTVVLNGRVVARAEPLLHRRGLQVWAA